jgi:hypothetical protein
MNNDRNSAETLENNFLSGIITSSIFLVAGISLIRFTEKPQLKKPLQIKEPYL